MVHNRHDVGQGVAITGERGVVECVVYRLHVVVEGHVRTERGLLRRVNYEHGGQHAACRVSSLSSRVFPESAGGQRVQNDTHVDVVTAVTPSVPV